MILARNDKIADYENFIQTKLQVDLQKIEAKRDEFYQQISQ